MKDIKIVQIVISPENSTYQGCILGLGSDGVVYFCPKGESKWDVYVPLEFIAKASGGNNA